MSYVIARLERAVRSAIQERVKAHDLTASQFTTLSILGRPDEPLSNAQLARRAYMTPQSMSEVIDALEQRGLIERSSNGRGRALPATLTPKGRRVLADCERAVDELEDEMLAGLGDRERARLLECLTGAVRALGAGLPPAWGRGPVNRTSPRRDEAPSAPG